LILAWYFSEIWPSDVGVRKPIYFPLMPSYWFPKSIARSRSTKATNNSDCLTGSNGTKVIAVSSAANNEDGVEMRAQQLCLTEEGGQAADSIPIEKVNEKLLGSPVVVVKNLRKTFGSATVVNDLSFTMYENQIFALLGHNGAGKSTTINILTGLTPPDYGDSTESSAFVYGKNIVDDMASIRYSLGVCPQHDVLFENLTVREHILLFSQLKGFSYEAADIEAEELTKLFHLDNRLDHLGHELSGGQRRKLSVAIAVCGGSKFVVLDEPTAGMDPLARRELWDLLSSLRRGRTILLTTHYMDEADVLGDRIGIMSLGQMQCMGSTHFLKTTYGAGYKFIVDTDKEFSSSKAVENNGTDSLKLVALTKFVQSYVPTAELVRDSTNMSVEHLTYNLPFDAVGQFGKFFVALESKGQLESLNLLEYNLSITSLEDVFLKVGEDHSVTPDKQLDIFGIGKDRVYHANFVSQVIGLMWRKLIHSRNDFTTIPLMLLPIAAIVAAAIIYKMKIITSNMVLNDIVTTGIYIGGYLGACGFLAEFIVRERADKLRNVLTVMGCSFEAYWLGTFLADFLLMLIPTVVMWITWGVGGMDHYYHNQGGLCFFLSLLFNAEMVAFSYFFSFVFTTPKSCISFMPMLILMLLVLPNVLILVAVEIAIAIGKTIAPGVLGEFPLIISVNLSYNHIAFRWCFVVGNDDFDATWCIVLFNVKCYQQRFSIYSKAPPSRCLHCFHAD
jgi:ATP-binding cassette, subfamily A (ABC1), member 3